MPIKYRPHCLILWLVLVFPQMVAAQSGQTSGPKVVELFTSQGCYSCPPAEKFLGELVTTQPDIVALEFHVDYWNDLVYGAAGKWEDPFSSADNTARQRLYNATKLSGQSGVFTPQMIIGGRYATVGSNRAKVLAALAGQDADTDPQIQVSTAREKTGTMTVSVSGPEHESVDVWLVRFDRQHRTEVPSGENKGKALTNYNVVRKMSRIGSWTGGALTIELQDLELTDNQGCAILIQTEEPGPIIGAARCPDV